MPTAFTTNLSTDQAFDQWISGCDLGPKLYGKGNTFNEWRLPTGINRLAEQTFGVD
jgi:hypothetical protein